MMKFKSSIVVLSLLSAMPSIVFAQELQGLSFSHGEWEIYCNNTGTCKAAGYNQEDGENQPASILLTRHAGENQAVKVDVALSDYEEELHPTALNNIHFYLNGKDLGAVRFTGSDIPFMGKLNPQQTQALLQTAKQQSEIIFKNAQHQWQISDKGMTATLLKMDDFQKRVGTVGAIIKVGKNNESQVLKAQAPLVVTKVTTAKQPYQILTRAQIEPKLYQRLMAALPKDIECEGGYNESESKKQPLEFYKLSNNKVLLKTLCWRGAYNEGYGIWVMDEKLTTTPKFITDNASDFSAGEIYSSQKGRGLGDCWANEQWIWNGQNFIKTEDRWSGMCKGLAAGGVWELNLIQSVVK